MRLKSTCGNVFGGQPPLGHGLHVGAHEVTRNTGSREEVVLPRRQQINRAIHKRSGGGSMPADKQRNIVYVAVPQDRAEVGAAITVMQVLESTGKSKGMLDKQILQVLRNWTLQSGRLMLAIAARRKLSKLSVKVAENHRGPPILTSVKGNIDFAQGCRLFESSLFDGALHA